MQHTLVLAYFSAAEVERYLVLASVLAAWPRPRDCQFEVLLATVCTGIEASAELETAFRAVCPVRSYRCQTAVTGYPARPTAMFWEIMDHVAATDPGDGSFAFWFEADMVPTRSSWLDELDAAWRRARDPLAMGMLMPLQYVAANGSLILEHINGGACYARRYAREVPTRFRTGTFDLAPWRHLARTGETAATDLIAFGTRKTLAADLSGARAAVLHAYRQDKAAFLLEWAARVRGESVPDVGVEVCCDLYAPHLGLRYCPLHSPWTPAIRAAQLAAIATGIPGRAIRRARRLL